MGWRRCERRLSIKGPQASQPPKHRIALKLPKPLKPLASSRKLTLRTSAGTSRILLNKTPTEHVKERRWVSIASFPVLLPGDKAALECSVCLKVSRLVHDATGWEYELQETINMTTPSICLRLHGRLYPVQCKKYVYSSHINM